MNWKIKKLAQQSKLMQKNWIGKSYGCKINFKIKNKEKIKVFTTRPDTILELHLLHFLLIIQLSKILKKIKIL